MRKSIKIVAVAAAATVMTYAVTASITAWAGEEPYVAYVSDDTDTSTFYLSGKLRQPGFSHRFSHFPGEEFEGFNTTPFQPEVCQVTEGPRPPDLGTWNVNDNELITAGNSGSYHWDIELPKKPEGNLNITIQCGIVKQDAEFIFGLEAVLVCAAETGERTTGLCNRKADRVNRSNIAIGALPRLTVRAIPQEDFDPDPLADPFLLTAYRNPSHYRFTRNAAGDALRNSGSMQVLDGSIRTRFALKACMTKTIFVKKPVGGQVNAAGEVEASLRAGDRISVWLDIPANNTVDIYCQEDSVSIQGIGEPSTRICWDPRDIDDDPDTPENEEVRPHQIACPR